MDQSMIMIPMYNPVNGAHCAIARVRFSMDRAQVELRRSGQSPDETLYLLTDKGAHAIRDGRAQYKQETLFGIASIDDKGICRCKGAVRGYEDGLERMLVRLRMERQSDKRAVPAKRSEVVAAPKITIAPVREDAQTEPVAEPVMKIVGEVKQDLPNQVRAMDGYKESGGDDSRIKTVVAPKAIQDDAIKCCRAMDGYMSASTEASGEAVEVFAANKANDAHGLIARYGSESEFLSAHPNVSGEEPGFAVWNSERGKAGRREGADTARPIMPINAGDEWNVDAPSAKLPTYQEASDDMPVFAEGLQTDDMGGRAMSFDFERPYSPVMPYRVDNPFPKQFPGSSWVKIQRLQGQGHYLEGRMRRGGEIMTITAAPGEYSPVPPRHLQGFTRYIQTKEGGFWVRIRKE